MFKTEIEEIGSFKFYARFYGIGEDGAANGVHTDLNNEGGVAASKDDESDFEESANSKAMIVEGPADLSTYKSKPEIMDFCKKLMSNQLSRTLLGMVVDRSCAKGVKLDLSKSNLVVTELQRLCRLYVEDMRESSSEAVLSSWSINGTCS